MSINTENIESLSRKNNIDININNSIIRKEIKSTNIRLVLYLAIKRVISFIGGFVGAIILVPMTVILYIARIILKENDGPLFYEQLRIGKNGKEFRLYKYRSMCMNADEKLEKYLAENEEARLEYQKYKKLKNDPRVTRLGKFIRKTSIDELPQLINCLRRKHGFGFC